MSLELPGTRDGEQGHRDLWDLVHALPTTLRSSEHFLRIVLQHLEAQRGVFTKSSADDLRLELKRLLQVLDAAVSRLMNNHSSDRAARNVPDILWESLGSILADIRANEVSASSVGFPEACNQMAASVVLCVSELRRCGAKLKNESLKDLTRAALELDGLACLHHLRLVIRQSEKTRAMALRVLNANYLSQQAAKPQIDCDINSIISGVMLQNRAFAKRRRLRFDSHLCPGRAVVRGVEEELTLVFESIVNNAIKYSDQLDPPREAWITIASTTVGASIEVTVQSWGRPITRDEVNSGRLFEFGYRGEFVRERYPDGTGVGLSKARSIIERHGGKIRIECDPDYGYVADPDYERGHFITTVTIGLPVFVGDL